ncbi:hypothetical protein NMY22_g12748 [Coprinellus aureogranulatus]|nr:hypothetical protein NMY22_g12748 [Coprinellus aureogranulatus]
MIRFDNLPPEVTQAMCTPMHLILPPTQNPANPSQYSGALYLGSLTAVMDKDMLREHRITHLVHVVDVPWLPMLEKEGRLSVGGGGHRVPHPEPRHDLRQRPLLPETQTRVYQTKRWFHEGVARLGIPLEASSHGSAVHDMIVLTIFLPSLCPTTPSPPLSPPPCLSQAITSSSS